MTKQYTVMNIYLIMSFLLLFLNPPANTLAEELPLPTAESIKTYSVETESSRLYWYSGSHQGYVLLKDGIIKVKDNEILTGRFRILMDSIVDTDIDYELMRLTLENILRSEEFFNTQHYPYALFTIINSFNFQPGKPYITGCLKITDTTHLVSFHCELFLEDDLLRAESEMFSIDRIKWGITSMSKDYVASENSYIVPEEIKFKIVLQARQS